MQEGPLLRKVAPVLATAAPVLEKVHFVQKVAPLEPIQKAAFVMKHDATAMEKIARSEPAPIMKKVILVVMKVVAPTSKRIQFQIYSCVRERIRRLLRRVL